MNEYSKDVQHADLPQSKAARFKENRFLQFRSKKQRKPRRVNGEALRSALPRGTG